VVLHPLVASPAFLRRHPLTRPEDLEGVPCAGFRGSADATLRWTLAERTVRLEPVVLANDYAQLRALALAGDVVTELPPFLAHEAVAAGALLRVLPRTPLPEFNVTAVFLERRHTSALVRTYLEFCATRAPELLTPSWERTPQSASVRRGGRGSAPAKRVH
jgi:DNA-binding transcriptional LysR family regulator